MSANWANRPRVPSSPTSTTPGAAGAEAAAQGLADIQAAMGRENLHQATGGRPPLDPAARPGEHSPCGGVRLPAPLNAQLDAVAAAQGRRPSDVIREAITRYLDEAS
jgi:hypothetical protein